MHVIGVITICVCIRAHATPNTVIPEAVKTVIQHKMKSHQFKPFNTLKAIDISAGPLSSWVIWPKTPIRKGYLSFFTATPTRPPSPFINKYIPTSKNRLKSHHWFVSDLIHIKLPDACQSGSCTQFELSHREPQPCMYPTLNLVFEMPIPGGQGVEKGLIMLLWDTDHKKVWRPVLNVILQSNLISSGHGESLYTRAELALTNPTPSKDVSRPQPTCQPLTLITRQSARSFHRVDAREREFDGIEVIEDTFEYRGLQFHEVIDEEVEIKIRPR